MAKGPTLPPSPSFIKYQPACKPGSGGHRFLAEAMRDGHSSGTLFAQRLEQPTRTASLTSPCGVIAASSELSAMPSLFGFAPGGVYHAVPVAGDAVRSYRTFSPLLAFTLAGYGAASPRACRAEAAKLRRRAVRSLWHFPWGRPRRTLSGTVCRWSPDFPPRRPFGTCRSGRPAD